MKVLRNILLTLSLAAMSSFSLEAMERNPEDLNICPETNILVLPEDLVRVIAQYLDGKAFSALTLTCKSNERFLNKMPVQYLLCVNCADSITHGNVNLTRRYLKNTYGTLLLESAERQDVGESQDVGNGRQAQCIKFLLGGEQIYSIAKNVEALDDMVFYVWLTKGSANNWSLLQLFSQKILQNDAQFFDFFGEIIHEDLPETLRNVFETSEESEYVPIVFGGQRASVYIETHTPSDAFICVSHTSDDKPHGDICFINTQNEQNRERTRFDYFCLNMLFIVVAQKNLGAIIDVFLQGESICKQLELPTLTIAADMATDVLIKQILQAEITRRNNVIQRV